MLTRIAQFYLPSTRLSSSGMNHTCPLRPIGRHFTMLTFRLFLIDVTNCVVISFRNCTIHPLASTICCHQPVSPTSPPGSEEHPYNIDQLLLIIHLLCSFKTSIALYHSYFVSTLRTISYHFSLVTSECVGCFVAQLW